jgi:plastocyanin
MTDSTTIDERPDGALPELHESEALGAEGHGAEEPLKDRFLLPLLLPLLSMIAVALLAINVSRVLLAGSEDSALAIGITILLVILVGASVISAMPRAKTSSLAVTLVVGMFVVLMAGLIALGPSLDDGEGGAAANPNINLPDPAASTVAVTAGPGLTFNGIASTGNYSATAGTVKITYGGASGHTLAIQDPKFEGFLLGTDAGAEKSNNVKLGPGTYTIYCTVPGHEAAGMKATITVAG